MQRAQPDEDVINALNVDLPTTELVAQMMRQPPPKAFLLYNHYSVSRPYDLVQLDILFLPTDKKFRYCLCAVDAASRFKWAQPMTNKSAESCLKAFINMKMPLDQITEINTDGGGEFAGAFAKFLKTNNIHHRVNKPSHHLAFVENFNGVLARRLFMPMHAHEMDTGEVSKDWVDRLQDTVTFFNDHITQMIKMKPIDAIKLNEVPQPANDIDAADTKKSYEIGTIVRRMFNHDEIYDFKSGTVKVEKRRKTDPWFSRQLYYVYNIMGDDDSMKYHWLIKIEDKPSPDNIYEHAYTYYQLQKIREANF